MKKILIFLLCLGILLVPTKIVQAVPSSGYVVDQDNKLTNAEIKELNEMAAKYSEELKADVGILIINSAGDMSTFRYVEKFYYDNGFSLDGILLIDNIGDKEWYIYKSGAIREEVSEREEYALWDAYIGQDNFINAGKSFLNAARELLINKTYGVTESGEVFVPGTRTLSRIEDRAHLLSTSERMELMELLDEISERQQVDVVIATVDGLEGKSSEAFADDYFDYNGFGMGNNYDGILLLISMADRDWAISTHGFGINAFTDAGQTYITDRIIPKLGNGDYFDAFKQFAQLSDRFITEAKEGKSIDTDNMPKNELTTEVMGAFAVIGAGLGSSVSAAYLGVQKRAHKSLTKRIYAGEYSSGIAHFRRQNDRFLRSNITRTPIPKAKPSGGGGGGSSTHRSSSGRSHGGSSGKF